MSSYRRAGKPDWVRSTPREMYAKGVRDAVIYLQADRMGLRYGMPFEPPSNLKSRDTRAFWGGMVAQAYGVNLQPNGRD